MHYSKISFPVGWTVSGSKKKLIIIMDGERNHSMGVQWTGLPHSPNTDSDTGTVTVRRPLKRQREIKKGGASGN